MSQSNGGAPPIFAGTAQRGAFRHCAASHGLRLHRIHLPAVVRVGLKATVVFDCSCGLRWLMRANEGEVVSADGEALAELKRGREALATAPPGFPGAIAEG
ncbi:MAG: hypothetical protein ACRD00_04325 [Thermoanaerobaculia bacterium]